jgi:hypothetical protein
MFNKKFIKEVGKFYNLNKKNRELTKKNFGLIDTDIDFIINEISVNKKYEKYQKFNYSEFLKLLKQNKSIKKTADSLKINYRSALHYVKNNNIQYK